MCNSINRIYLTTVVLTALASIPTEGKVAGKPCYSPRTCEIRVMTNGHIGMKAMEDPILRLFRARLINKISRAWHPSKKWDGDEGYTISVLLNIQSDGHIGNCEIEQSSGKVVTDEDALKAVRKADRFEIMPKSIGEKIDIELQFSVSPQRGTRVVHL